GQNLGAGRPDRAARAGWLATRFCTLLGRGAFGLELRIPRQFASLFTSDPAVIAEAVRYLRIASVSQLAVCAEVVLEGALGGAGETVPPMIASTALTAPRIPLAALAGASDPLRGSRGRSVGFERDLVGHLADGDRSGIVDGGALALGAVEA